MKKTIVLLLLAALLLTGCSIEDPHLEWDQLVRADNLLAAETPEGFTLNESKGALSLNGVYYFTWSKGAGSKITNAQGEDALVYDCQIYLLAAQCDGLEAAKKHIAEWSVMEEKSYEITQTGTVEVASGSYDCMMLKPQKDGSPFTAGAAAFAASDTAAVSVEIFSANGFEGDLLEILQTFLNGIRMD